MIKYISYWPQFKAESHYFKDNECVISITDPLDVDVVLKHAQVCLRLRFLDVDDLGIPGLNKSLCYNRNHSIVLKQFIDSLPESIDTVIVHCRMGVSRSAAVALALEAYTGAELKQRELAGYANKLIIKELSEYFQLKNDIIIPQENLTSLITYDF